MRSCHRLRIPFAIAIVACLGGLSTADAEPRKWSDTTGAFTITATLIGYNAKSVVLEKKDGKLITLPLSDLSKSSREYLRKVDKRYSDNPNHRGVQVWKLRTGLKVVGRVVDYHEHDVVVQSRWGKPYVNNRPFSKLPGIYQEIVPLIVQHFTKEKIDGQRGLQKWARAQKGAPRTFRCRGLLMELSDESLYCIPLFLFPEETIKALKPGWDRWLAAKNQREQREHESFLLRAQTRAMEQEGRRLRQLEELRVFLQGVEVGLYDLWQVALYPPRGKPGIPRIVIVPGRNSAQAQQQAKLKFPAYIPGETRRLNRS